MSVAILSLGTELVRGELVNGNARWLAEAVSDEGLEVSEIACVGDHPAQIVETLARLGHKQRFIVCTGGLGPTTDDVTTAAAAEVLGKPLVLDAHSLERIKQRFQRFGRSMEASNQKQALFPEGARVLDNLDGTAPGFAIRIGEADAYFLPGVPHEMRLMFESYVRPALASTQVSFVHQVRLNTFGRREAAINDMLDGIENEFGVELGYRAHFPEIQVKVLARAASAQPARALAEHAALAVEERLGSELVFSRGEETLPQAVGRLLEKESLLLGLAESCTGGLCAELFTRHAGASQHFAGAVVCYADQVKQRTLGVPGELLAAHGAVSQPVAEAMARGVCQALGVRLGLAITGIAGPSGATPEKPVGLVHLALCHDNSIFHAEHVFPGERWQVQWRAAFTGLSMLRQRLLETAGAQD